MGLSTLLSYLQVDCYIFQKIPSLPQRLRNILWGKMGGTGASQWTHRPRQLPTATSQWTHRSCQLHRPRWPHRIHQLHWLHRHRRTSQTQWPSYNCRLQLPWRSHWPCRPRQAWQRQSQWPYRPLQHRRSACFVGLINLGNFDLVSHLGVGLIGYIGIGLNGISLVGIGFFGVKGLISFVGIGFFCINGLISVDFVGLVNFISSLASTLLLLASLASLASLALSVSLVLLVLSALASMASSASALLPLASASFASNSKSKWNNHYITRLWGRRMWHVRTLIFILYYGQTHTLEMQYKTQNNYFSADFCKLWPNNLSWGSVRIFLCGCLFVWLQYLVSKMEFMFLKSPRGFRSSLGQRSQFIDSFSLFCHFVDFITI